MAAWFDPLLARLAEQPPDTLTVTLTLDELEALASEPMPARAITHVYWQRHGSAPRQRLAAIGWSMVRINRQVRTLTFARIGRTV